MTDFRHMRSPLRDRLVEGRTPARRRQRNKTNSQQAGAKRSRQYHTAASILRPLTSWRMPVIPRGAGIAAAFVAVIMANVIVIGVHGSAFSSSQVQLDQALPVEQLAAPKMLSNISLTDGMKLLRTALKTSAKVSPKPPTKVQTKTLTKSTRTGIKTTTIANKHSSKTEPAQEISTTAARAVQASQIASSLATKSQQNLNSLLSKKGHDILHASPEMSRIGQDHLVERVLANRQTVAAALHSEGIDHLTVHKIVKALGGLFDFRQSRPGDKLSLTVSPSGEVQRFVYVSQNGGPAGARFIVEREAQGLQGHREEIPISVKTALVSGHIDSSLYTAMVSTGESPSLISAFTSVFGWDIDFYREVKQNDRFRMLVEKRYAEGRFIGYGRLLAGEYAGKLGTYRAFYYKDDKIEGYFNDNGESMEKTFLRAPVQVVRITSTYGLREHPILGYTRRHNGVDYGVPRGTPIWAVANGRVVAREHQRGYGNVIKLRHPNGYMTLYAHMSKFGSFKVGQKVKQRDIIGYCGSTGLSTGPHVHFGMKKHGHYVNPLKQKFPRGKSLPKASRAEFKVKLQQLSARLDAAQLALADFNLPGQG